MHEGAEVLDGLAEFLDAGGGFVETGVELGDALVEDFDLLVFGLDGFHVCCDGCVDECGRVDVLSSRFLLGWLALCGELWFYAVEQPAEREEFFCGLVEADDECLVAPVGAAGDAA